MTVKRICLILFLAAFSLFITGCENNNTPTMSEDNETHIRPDERLEVGMIRGEDGLSLSFILRNETDRGLYYSHGFTIYRNYEDSWEIVHRIESDISDFIPSGKNIQYTVRFMDFHGLYYALDGVHDELLEQNRIRLLPGIYRFERYFYNDITDENPTAIASFEFEVLPDGQYFDEQLWAHVEPQNWDFITASRTSNALIVPSDMLNISRTGIRFSVSNNFDRPFFYNDSFELFRLEGGQWRQLQLFTAQDILWARNTLENGQSTQFNLDWSFFGELDNGRYLLLLTFDDRSGSLFWGDQTIQNSYFIEYVMVEFRIDYHAPIHIVQIPEN